MLKDALVAHQPDFVFLSESQIFQCDLDQFIHLVKEEYCYHLNSEDSIDPILPLDSNRAKGGTMALWKKKYDPFVKIISASTASILPIIVNLPGVYTIIQAAIYLPTHGQDSEFVSELANLTNCLDDLTEKYHDAPIFVRGDANVNKKNINRVTLLRQLMDKFNMKSVDIPHKTYHHFVGDGKFDSNVDILLHSSESASETVTSILCIKEYPAMLSHHDIILSSFTVPTCKSEEVFSSNLVTAPRLDHPRYKILWTPEGSQEYSELVSSHLRRLRENWLQPSSKASMSILLQLTNTILSSAATLTNQFTLLGTKQEKKPSKVPASIKKTKNAMIRAHKAMKRSGSYSDQLNARANFNCTKKKYRHSVKKYRVQSGTKRDEKLSSILGKNPTQLHRYLKSCRKTQAKPIASLTVGDKTYIDSAVPDGFFDSMSSLKQCKPEELEADPDISERISDYENILKLCQEQEHPSMPPISMLKSSDLLKRMKKDVRDFYSITALHYSNAGSEGLEHFNLLLNGIINDVNNATIEELNIAYGLILYKGHGKDKTSDRAYRTISTCPFLAKSLDLYIRDLYLDLWTNQEADTQYQGTGSSHELASLLVTEVIQHSMYVADKPVYLLALDAQSAFDRCLRQILVCELFKAEVPPSAIMFIDNRLKSRTTVYEWDGQQMGPAKDVTGFEQGGINSSDYYKLYNNNQLKTAQKSQLGVDLGSVVISAVGQADDVMLASNSLYSLRLLVTLTEDYCAKYRVKLEPGKTKLLAYSNKAHEFSVIHDLQVNRISIGGISVMPVTEAEHVGVVRNTNGNLPNILQRIVMHKKALGSVLSAGIAKGHRGNPAASLKVHQLYATSVLFSGLASLVLLSSEITIIESYFRTTLQKLLRLHIKTPRAIVYFLAGSLPGDAILHQKQLSLFTMICHLPDDPLHKHALHVLTLAQKSAKSWFLQVRDICCLYGLPHPLELLNNPQPKQILKRLIKAKIAEYWHKKLSSECHLPSLQYFDPSRHSLLTPHPMWTASGSNSYECNKSTVVARMVSGRYRTESLCRFWSTNRNGYCSAPTCDQAVGDIEHLLVVCPALHHVRNCLVALWHDKTSEYPALYDLLTRILASNPTSIVSFILDPSSNPEIIGLSQSCGSPLLELVFYLTRSWAYSIHREKMIQTGRWTGNKGLARGHPSTASASNLTKRHHQQTSDRPNHDRHVETYHERFNDCLFSGDVPIQCPEAVSATECEVPIDSLPDTVQDLSSLMLPGPVHPAGNLQEVIKSATLVDMIGPGNCGGADGVPTGQQSSTAATRNQSGLQSTVPPHVSNYPHSEVLSGVSAPLLAWWGVGHGGGFGGRSAVLEARSSSFHQ